MAPKQSFESPIKAKNYMNIHSKLFRNDERSSGGSSSDLIGENDRDDSSFEDNHVPAQFVRRVRFSMSVKKHVIINRDDYTSKEWDNCFYKLKEEMKSAKKRAKIVKRMEEGKKEKKTKMTYRGLESATAKGKKEFDEEVNKCIAAVMDEQDHQWYIIRVDDYGRIAAASEDVTFESKERARAIAIEDEEEAMSCYDDCEDASGDEGESVFTDVTDFTATTKKRLKSKRKQKEMTTARRLDPPGARVALLKANSIPHLTGLRKKGRAKKRNSTEEAPKRQ